MPAYDGNAFDPPAPVAEVTIGNPATGADVEGVRMLIDSGADVTVVPQSVVEALGLSIREAPEYEVAGFGEGRSSLPVVQLRIGFLGRSFRGQFLVVDRDYGILGRNVLNAVRIVLDGPKSSWVLDDRT